MIGLMNKHNEEIGVFGQALIIKSHLNIISQKITLLTGLFNSKITKKQIFL